MESEKVVERYEMKHSESGRFNTNLEDIDMTSEHQKSEYEKQMVNQIKFLIQNSQDCYCFGRALKDLNEEFVILMDGKINLNVSYKRMEHIRKVSHKINIGEKDRLTLAYRLRIKLDDECIQEFESLGQLEVRENGTMRSFKNHDWKFYLGLEAGEASDLFRELVLMKPPGDHIDNVRLEISNHFARSKQKHF